MRWDYDAFRKRAPAADASPKIFQHASGLRSIRYHVRFPNGRWNRHVFRPDAFTVDLVDEFPTERCRCQ